MLFAAIDIGSNAARLLFSNVYLRNGKKFVKKASFVRVPLRLGMEVFETGRLTEKKTDKLIDTLKAFKYLMNVNEPLSYKACATAAMREAANNSEVLERIGKEAGIKVDIIDGLTEAKIIGATNNIALKDQYNLAMYVDVGGGSTEITLIKKNGSKSAVVDSRSFKIGTIKLLNNKVDDDEWSAMKEWIKNFRKQYGKIYCIGSGGNINKIVKIYGKRSEKLVSYDNLKYAYEHLNRYTVEERIYELGLRADRADVIAPAAQIYLSVLKWAKIRGIFVPKIGLADGLIHLLYEEHATSVMP